MEEKKDVHQNPSGKPPRGLGSVGYSIELRDLIAMQAMTSILSRLNPPPPKTDLLDAATASYIIADVMLWAREIDTAKVLEEIKVEALREEFNNELNGK